MLKKIFIICCGLCTFIQTNEEGVISCGFLELQFTSYIPLYGSVRNVNFLYPLRISFSYNSDLNYHNFLLWTGVFFDFGLFNKSWQIDMQILSFGYSDVFIKPSSQIKISLMTSYYFDLIASSINIKGILFVGYLNEKIHLNFGLVANFSLTDHCTINVGGLYKDIKVLNKKLLCSNMKYEEREKKLNDIVGEEPAFISSLDTVLSMKKNENDRHILLLGPPGSGKTYSMVKFMKLCEENNVCSFFDTLFGHNCGGYTGKSFPDYMIKCVNKCRTKEQALNMVLIFDEIDKVAISKDTMRQEVMNMMLTYTTSGAFINDTKFGSVSTKNMSFILLGSFSNVIPYANSIRDLLFTENDKNVLKKHDFSDSIDYPVNYLYDIYQEVKNFDKEYKFRKEIINYFSILFFALIFFDNINYREFLNNLSNSVNSLDNIMSDIYGKNPVSSSTKLKFDQFLTIPVNVKNKIDDKVKLIRNVVTSVDLIDRVKFFEIKDCNENIDISSVVSYYRDPKKTDNKTFETNCNIDFNNLNLREILMILSVKIKNWNSLREMNQFVESVRKVDALYIENSKKEYLNIFSKDHYNYVDEDKVKFIEKNNLDELIKIANWVFLSNNLERWFKNGSFNSEFLKKDILDRFNKEIILEDVFDEVIKEIANKNTKFYNNPVGSVENVNNMKILLNQNKNFKRNV